MLKFVFTLVVVTFLASVSFAGEKGQSPEPVVKGQSPVVKGQAPTKASVVTTTTTTTSVVAVSECVACGKVVVSEKPRLFGSRLRSKWVPVSAVSTCDCGK